ncbi:uncharacterized protein LOC144064948 isoform X2 [Stigmatopora argus]
MIWIPLQASVKRWLAMATAQPPHKRQLSASSEMPALSAAESAGLGSEEAGTESGVAVFHYYQRDVLNKDGVELCFEEVRAKDFHNRRQKRLHDERQCLRQEKMQLELQVARIRSLSKSSGLPPPPHHGMSEAEPEPGPGEDARLPDRVARSRRQGEADPTPLPPEWESFSAEEVGPELVRRAAPPDGDRQPWARRDLPPCLDSEAPLPDVREYDVVCLGGTRYQTSRRLLEESGVLAYEGSRGQCSVIIKLSREFDTFAHVMEEWPAGPNSPLLRRFRFRDGCVTVYEAPPSRVFSAFSECQPPEEWSSGLALSLLWLMAAMRARGAAPADLRPDVVVSCHAAGGRSDCLFPLEWCAADTREDRDPDRDRDQDQVDSPDVTQNLHLLLNECKMATLEGDGRQTGGHSGETRARASTGSPWGDAVRSLLKLDSWTSEQRELFADRCEQLESDRSVSEKGVRFQ